MIKAKLNNNIIITGILTNFIKITKVQIKNKSMLIILGFLLITRLLSMHYVPLNDSTEARYGEIARIMLETGNWITPMHHYGDPFLAKPPLSIWLSAISMKLFGVNAFAARLPALLLSIGILFIIYNFAKKHISIKVARNSIIILASSFYFLLDAGTVMTDPCLLFCITLGFVSFWEAIIDNNNYWGYIFFVSLGLGLLSKGPVEVVLVSMPLFIWTAWKKQWSGLFKNLPWFSGIALILLIALPWYVLAEIRTPGFLSYFIIGEHFHRFLDPGWTGDKYGFAHVAPYGMIWVYAFIGFLPWTACIIDYFYNKNYKNNLNCSKDLVNYLLLCSLVPLVFFTFARNIIYPYVFPSLPTGAIILACLPNISKRNIILLAPISGVIFLVVTMLFIFKPQLVEKSQKRVVEIYQQDKNLNVNSKLIYWTYKTDYSAQFYSQGHAIATLDDDYLYNIIKNNNIANYVVIDADEKKLLPKELTTKLINIGMVSVLKKKYNIFRTQV